MVVNSTHASRIHARIYGRGAHFVIADQSSNGTFVAIDGNNREVQLRREEAIVFKVYDSLKDGRARFTPHTSFVDPATPPGAAPRQSIEARTLAFF